MKYHFGLMDIISLELYLEQIKTHMVGKVY